MKQSVTYDCREFNMARAGCETATNNCPNDCVNSGAYPNFSTNTDAQYNRHEKCATGK